MFGGEGGGDSDHGVILPPSERDLVCRVAHGTTRFALHILLICDRAGQRDAVSRIVPVQV